jgi:uncharacterized protein (TIGR03067 family)
MTMKSVTILLLAVVLASTGCSKTARASAAAPGAPEDSTQASADDQQKLQGTWRMQSAMYNGQPLMNDVRWIFDGDHMTVVLKGNYEGGVKGNFQLGTGDAPNTILIKYFDNPLANQGYYGGSYTGIYKLSGDKLRVCYDMTGRQYPKSFDAGKGSLRMTYEFTREKTEKHADGA